MAFLPQFVRAGDTVIDIGAYRGVYTYPLARLVGSSGHVIAYEPQPALVSYLTAAARWGAMRRVDVRGYALSASEGMVTLRVPIAHGHRIDGHATLRDIESEVTTHTVQTRVLDKEPLPGPVSFMKIDVEGHELPLLEGAKAVLERYKPTMLIEVVYPWGGKRTQDLAAFLLDEYGYAASELRGGELAPVDRSRWHSEALNFQPDGRFVCNFVFQAQ